MPVSRAKVAIPGKRQVRMTLPNPQSEKVRRRVANSVARLNQSQEADALQWVEAVSEFDERSNPSPNAHSAGQRKNPAT